MKKFIAIMLCLIMLVSVVAISVSAADTGALGVNVAELLRPYGITPTFVPENISTPPVMDGVVNNNEYTSKRVFEAKKEDGVALPYELNFGGLAAPQDGYSVTEYVAQDEENIYVAFVYTENVWSVEFRCNLSQSAIFDGAGIENTGDICIKLPEGTDYAIDGYESNSNGIVTTKGGKGINNDSDFSFKSLKYGDNPLTVNKVEPDEYDAVAKRHFDGYYFENVTAEFRISKEAIMNATMENETEVRSIGYYCLAEREAFCDLSRITLQTFLPDTPFVSDGYDGATDFLRYNYGEAAEKAYTSSWRVLRYICFFEDTYVPGQAPSTMPTNLLGGGTTQSVTTTTPTTEITTTVPSTTESTTTQTATTTNDPLEDPAHRPSTTTVDTSLPTSQTSKVTTSSCQNSLSLSALAIVPLMSVSVVLVAKKKDN